MNFTIYNEENAPEDAKPFLKGAKEKFGFVPNLLGEFAEAPAVLEGYLKLDEIIGKTDFTPQEQQLAILAVSIENECHYCSAIHSTVLKNQLNTDENIVNSVRNGDPLPDAKLNALVNYTRKAVEKRGHVSEGDLEAFLSAGYSKKNALEINLIIALKTISNYTNHLADTPLDEAFQPEAIEFETA
ncbi:carboxymuconolactone decarboxylase family protein [Gracilimonas sp.]|uniref:carboxymuconolactone decarboxylase family protein n=1 Tax=Gracilimonas sp. TaxID=1974203 RepID=UPI0028724542|nr:carboxymuconolactone decarboxylase family protein [Gracilimonas sp.]